MNDDPLFSIIIPVFNGEPFIEKTVNSVLAQEFQNLEVIIVDDCSTDGSRNILRRLAAEHPSKIKIIENCQNLGLMKTNNVGLAAAKGTYAIFLGQDDLLCESHIREIIKEFDDQVSLVFVNSYIIDEMDVVGQKVASDSDLAIKTKKVKRSLISGNFIPSVGLTIRKSLLEDVGGYPENYKNWGEWVLWARLSGKGEIRFSKRVCALYRRHSGNISAGFQTYRGMKSLFPYYIFSMKECVRINNNFFIPRFLFFVFLLRRTAKLGMLWVRSFGRN